MIRGVRYPDQMLPDCRTVHILTERIQLVNGFFPKGNAFYPAFLRCTV